MLKNAYLVAKIGADTAENERIFPVLLPKIGNYQVKDGQVGVTYKDGIIELLEAGRHFLLDATHILSGFLSVGQQTLRIAEVTESGRRPSGAAS